MQPDDSELAGHRATWLGSALAALGPLLYALTISPAFPPLGGGAALLDGALRGELSADLPEPLALVGARALSLLPLGPLALRVNVSAALWLSLAAGAAYRALDAGLHGLGLSRAVVASPLALGAVWLAFGCGALSSHDVHAHAPALALCALALERMSAALEHARIRARACLRMALLWLALLAVEQPLLAIGLALGSAPALVLGLAERGALPARAGALWPAALVAPLAVWAWHSADGAPFAHALSALALRAPSLAALREIAWTPSARAVLAAGAVGLLLVRSLRGGFGLFIGSALALLFAATLSIDPSAPAAALLLLAALLAAGGIARALLSRADGWLALAVALAAVALGLSQLQAEGKAALAHDGRGHDVLDDELRGALPPRALSLLSPGSLRARRAAEREALSRPDVALIAGPWRLDLRSASALERQWPELRALLRAELLSPTAVLPELQALAAERPVLLELDPGLDTDTRRALVPYGLLHQLVTSEVSKSDLRVASAAADLRLDRLQSLLEPEHALPELHQELSATLLAAAQQAEQSGDPERAQRLRARADSWNATRP